VRAFVHGLRDLGYENGRSLVLDMRSLEGKLEGLGPIAAELAHLNTDVIVVPTFGLAARVHAVTKTIPIVSAGSPSDVDRSVVASLARPGAMVTGIAGDVGTGIQVKRLELLAALLPKGARIAYIGTRRNWESDGGKATRDAAQRLGLEMFLAEGSAGKHEAAFAAVRRERPLALFVASGPESYARRQAIGEFAAGAGVASSCAGTEFLAHGCLMSYSPDISAYFRDLAGYVDRILKGAKPGELPIEQPTRFEFVINLKVAKALGIAIPQSLLLRAERVIE